MTFIENKSYYKRVFGVGVFLLIIVMIAAANFGVADISFKQTALIITSKIPIVNNFVSIDGIKSTSITILLNLRLPRILLACLVGAALSVVGTSFQGIFKNPMADPFVLGVSSGAALGATITMVFLKETHFLGMSMVALTAFIGAIITTFLVYNIARVGTKVPVATLLLAGIAINYLLSSIISLMMTFNSDNIEKIVMWTMGSFSTAGWNEVILLSIIVVPSILFISTFSRDLNIMLLGEDSARSLGIDVNGFKKYIFVISTLMVAAVVSVSGIIGFVGLIVPHAIRMIFGSDNRVVIPFSALGGAIFLVICDTLARVVVPPSEIPVGIITSIFGVPFFIYLLYRTKKKAI
ncbi:iron chelate uptake ABC transporter family permease subunit [Clostridium tagluense]|uniref:Corrinoid ABC transporter permease n=1 Tax=Clostridium tagluense TaxID=360422 RepID=A0A401UQY7_9CLOT|nr:MULTISPECIES: iron chelate uptake ABC transporter family permease subunit [Clostridium]MBU3130242.1 iron chelate uptake ABC transporter family permease subunit [Clostridium tagluense]MBZ9623517.1 iron chelate uptake ABC transporter family permease subunit [Clostridium sp. FP2]MCB2301004.1 iron chelate uptake ABC transporter family permease subunit [Clostridium tagluense]MCB2313837.1 iron chelate uptake ABC transporter family permease subunit [Clostridium tagluense]MCB2318682.1 iron chelate 